jgi:hypothetical protein
MFNKIPKTVSSQEDALAHIKHGNKEQQLNALKSPHAKSIHIFHALNSKHSDVKELATSMSRKQMNNSVIRRQAGIPQLLESLLEDVYSVVNKKYGNKISKNDIDFYHTNLKHPSHLEWAVKQHLKGHLNKDNFETVNDNLDTFKRNKGKFKSNDINNYSVESLHDEVSNVNKPKKESAYSTHVKSGEFEGQHFSIHIPHNHPAAVELAKLPKDSPHYDELGGKTKWCTAADSENGKLNHEAYSKHSDLYNIHLGNRKYQYNSSDDGIYSETNLKDEHDRDLEGDEKQKIHRLIDTHLTNHTYLKDENDYQSAINKGVLLKRHDIFHIPLTRNSTIIHSFKHFGQGNVDAFGLDLYNTTKPDYSHESRVIHSRSIPLVRHILSNAHTITSDGVDDLIDSAKNDDDVKLAFPHSNKGQAAKLFELSSHKLKHELSKTHGDFLASSYGNNTISDESMHILSKNKSIPVDDLVKLYHKNYAPDTHNDEIVDNIRNNLHNTQNEITTNQYTKAVLDHKYDLPDFHKHLESDLLKHKNNGHDISNVIHHSDMASHPEHYDFVMKHGDARSKLKVMMNSQARFISALHNNDVAYGSREALYDKYKSNPSVHDRMLKNQLFMQHIALSGSQEAIDNVYKAHNTDLTHHQVNNLKNFHRFVKHRIDNDANDKYNRNAKVNVDGKEDMFPFLK